MDFIISSTFLDPSDFDYEDEEYASPVNIRTALYGLFLIAKDHTTDKRTLNTINKAIIMIDNISDEEMYHAFGDVWPPDDLSIENIITIAKSVKSLHKVISEYNPEQQEKFEKRYSRVVRIIDKAFINNME